jgi:hypothetical protein
MYIEEEVVQDISIENIFNKIIVENFPNLEKKIIQAQEAFRHKIGNIKTETFLDIL